MRSILSYIGMLILPGALLIFTRGIIECRKTLEFVYLSLPANGTIIEMKKEYEGARIYYRPVVEFRLNKKHTFKFEAAAKTRTESFYKIGEKVGVRYLPQYPHFARIDSFRQMWGDGTDALGTGTVFTIAALFLIKGL